MFNNIFNDKRMEEFIDKYDEYLLVNSEENPISTWITKLENNELIDEKTNYMDFFDIILKELLGYTRDDIEFENNIGKEGHPVEFTLKKDDTDFVVLELKGTTYKDLTKRKNGRISPVEQASNYASAKKETKWAIVSIIMNSVYLVQHQEKIILVLNFMN